MRQQGLRVHSGATERRGRGQTERLHQRVRKVNASSSSGASRAEARWPGGGDVGFSETWAGQMPLPAGAQLGRGEGAGLRSDRLVWRTRCVRVRVQGCVWRIVVVKVEVWMCVCVGGT